MAIFLFLEVRDSPVVGLLKSLRSILREHPSSTPIHITIRGPYKKLPSAKQVSHFWEIIKAQGVLLNGVAHFDLPDRRVVYLRAASKVIRTMWWKPDYPIQEYGFNPHITLYEGPVEKAEIVEKFLKKERLEFLCTDLTLRFHDTSQKDLLSPGDQKLIETDSKSSSLIRQYRWKEGIEQRATALVQGWPASKS